MRDGSQNLTVKKHFVPVPEIRANLFRAVASNVDS